MTSVPYMIIVNLTIWPRNTHLLLTISQNNVTNLLLSQLAGFGFMQNIWCSFAEYICDPVEIWVFLPRSKIHLYYSLVCLPKQKCSAWHQTFPLKSVQLKWKWLFNCPLHISKCLLSVLERCPSYRDLKYSKWLKKWQGPKFGVRFIEVSILSGCLSWGVWLYTCIQGFL